MTRARRLLVLTVLMASVGSACAIQPEAVPNDLPAERSNVFGDPATGDEAAGTNRVYLLAPADTDQPERLRSVLRDVPTEPAAVLESLFAGPNTAERDEGSTPPSQRTWNCCRHHAPSARCSPSTSATSSMR